MFSKVQEIDYDIGKSIKSKIKNVLSKDKINFLKKCFTENLGKILPTKGKVTLMQPEHRSSQQPEACNFIKKETLAQVFSCGFCEISKNTFFT